MSNTNPLAGTTARPAAVPFLPHGVSLQRIELWVFVALLLLALIGAALNEGDETSRWVYWSALVLIYGGVSIGLTWLGSRERAAPTWTTIRSAVLHWLGALIAIKIVLLFELEDITARGAAADMSLVLLALSTFLAGVQFNWTYMPLGIILAVTAVGLGFLDQFTIFLVTVPLAVLAIYVVARRLRAPAA